MSAPCDQSFIVEHVTDSTASRYGILDRTSNKRFRRDDDCPEEVQEEECAQAVLSGLSWSALHEGLSSWLKTPATTCTELESRMHLVKSWREWLNIKPSQELRDLYDMCQMPNEVRSSLLELLDVIEKQHASSLEPIASDDDFL